MTVIKFPDFVNHTVFLSMFGKQRIIAPSLFINFYDRHVQDSSKVLDFDLSAMEFVVLDTHIGYLRKTENVTLPVSISGNYFSQEVNSDCLGVIATLFCLSELCMMGYRKNWKYNHLIIASDALKDRVSLRDDRSTIWKAID